MSVMWRLVLLLAVVSSVLIGTPDEAAACTCAPVS